MKKETFLEMPMSQMTSDDLQRRLLVLSRRAKSLCGVMLVNGKPVPMGAAVSGFMEDIAGQLTDPAKIKMRDEFLKRVETGDPEARRQFCALRMESYDNYLIAQLEWIKTYFEIITLGDTERPYVENTTGREMSCFYISRGGKPDMMKLGRDVENAALPLRTLTTPLVRYRTWDIYRGNIVDQAVRSLTMSRDLTNKMEAEAKALITGSTVLGAFTFTGAKPNWPYVANSYVNTANLPTTNDIAVTGAEGFFDLSTLDEILDYCRRWAKLSAQGDLRPTGLVRVASSQIRKFGTGTSSSGYPFQKIAEKLLEDGQEGVHYRGVDWVFDADPTLNPADNYAYPEFNMKAGKVYLKPSGDKEFIRNGETDYELFTKEEEERGMKRVFAAAVNSATRRNMARFCFTDVTP